MSTKQTEALKLALEEAANYIDALGGDSRKYRQALAEHSTNRPISRLDAYPKEQVAAAKEDVLSAVEHHGLSEQPAQQEPVAWWHQKSDTFTSGSLVSNFVELTPLYTSPPAQHQELAAASVAPVSVTYKEVADAMNALYKGDNKQVQIAKEMENKKLYTSPPASKPWVGLTDEEIDELDRKNYGFPQPVAWRGPFARAVEAKLKERNS